MINRIAVIDLGTNTCNLLIAEFEQKNYRILFQEKEVVKLGKDRINKDELSQDALDRTVAAFRRHQERILEFGTKDVVTIGTSAIREASNKEWFLQQVQSKTGLQISIISGEREADLIFKGVRLAFERIENLSLILDIGGGSNEFILTEKGKAVWQQSFPLGMARIIEKFPLSNPISDYEIDQIWNYYVSNLENLWERMKGKRISCLIGCSGAFDTIVDLIDQSDPGKKMRISQEIKISDFDEIYRRLIKSTTEERMMMKGMESIRVEMIVPSAIFIKMVLTRLNIPKIYQTDFALREGVLYEKIFI